MKYVRSSVLAVVFGAALLFAQDKAIDVRRSTITIHAGKAGLFSAAGHEHWINAPISAAVLNDSDSPRVEFRVDASKMEVKPDPKVDAKTQAEIQRDMQEKTLESATYPEITFRSSHVNKLPEGSWRVEGTLTLHGVSKPVTAGVKRDRDGYAGHAILKQTDFGIKPISVAGGTVKVKNEIEIDFHIVARPQ
ncbi:MAG: YceI family protein [Bryobacteraceae bacterium]